MASWRRRHRLRHRSARAHWQLPRLGGVAAIAAIVLGAGIGQLTGSRAAAAVPSAAARAGAGPQTATYYSSRGMGNCSYPRPPADGLYVALSTPEYAKAARCGGYLEVRGPDGSVRVKVVDRCPGCAAGHIDLSEAAFARLARLSAGRIDVTYRRLADPPLPGPLTVEVKRGSSRYWLGLLADNTGNPLASVQVRTSSGWLPLRRGSDNYWDASGAGRGPFTVRLTDTKGHQATVRGITLRTGAAQATGTWMYRTGGGQPPVTPTPTPAVTPPATRTVTPPVTPPAARTVTPTATPAVTPTVTPAVTLTGAPRVESPDAASLAASRMPLTAQPAPR
jgi:expansin